MNSLKKFLLGIDVSNLKKQNGFNTANEIVQQPITWIECIKNLIDNKKEIEDLLDKFLSENNYRIILTGAGSSAFAGETIEPYLTKLLNNRVEAIPTTDLISSPMNYFIKNVPTLLISFARSGNSPESIHAIKLANSLVDELYEIVISCNKDGKLAQEFKKDDKGLLLIMPERTNDLGFAMTSSFTTMILSCIGIFNINNINKLYDDIKILSTSTEQFIENNIKSISKLASENFDRIVYLGSLTSKAIAKESALKILELTSGKINASYDTPLGFRHGPKSVIDDKTITVIYISNNEYTKKYDLDLVKELLMQRKNDKVIVVGSSISDEIIENADYTFNLENTDYNIENEALYPVQQIIFAQILSLLKSLNLNITPDNPCKTGEVNRVVKGVILYDLI